MSHMTNNKALVFMDIDDTLVNDNQQISDFTKKVIQQAQEKAIFYVATGRMFASAQVIADDINAQVVASNGGIYQIRDQIFQHTLGANNLTAIYHVLEANNLSAFFFSDHQVFYNNNLPGYFKHSSNNRIASPDPNNYIQADLQTVLKHKQEIINSIIIEDNDLTKLAPAKKQLQTTTDLNVSSSFKNNLELIPNGVSKATAIEQIQAQYQITPEQTFTFGDGENDIEMFKTSKYSVAMGNANELVKSHAHFETDRYTNDGVAKFIKKYLL